MFTIRPAGPADAAAMVALQATVHPYLVRGKAALTRTIAAPPPGEDRVTLVATAGEQVVGTASAARNLRAAAADAGQLSMVAVHPDHRRQGIGDALVGAAFEHFRAHGVGRIGGLVQPPFAGFARRHGFEPTREVHFSALELSRLPGAPVDPGVPLVPLGEVAERALYDADCAAATDEPGDLPPAPTPYALWRHEIWDNDDLDRAASTAAVADGRVLAFMLVLRDGVRVWSDMTATVPAWRGRGLARLVKWTALRVAADRGAMTAYTANDGGNRPMLAVNDHLGYRPVATQIACVTIW